MRLREIQKIISDNIETLESLNTEQSSSAGQVIITITEYSELRSSILNLLETGLFKDEKIAIDEEQWLPSSASNKMPYGKNSFDAFKVVLDHIAYKAEGMLTLITDNLHSDNENSDSIVISLPNRVLTIEEFTDVLITLKDTFKLLKILKEFQTDIIIDNFDVGSKWIVTSVMSSMAVSLFGKLVTIVQRSQVGTRQIKLLDKQLEYLDLEEETRNSVRDAQLLANQAIYANLAEQFLETNDLEAQSEIISQMSRVVENVDKVLSMGVGFEAAISASNDVAKTFPTLKEQKLLDNIKVVDSLKQIDHDPTE